MPRVGGLIAAPQKKPSFAHLFSRKFDKTKGAVQTAIKTETLSKIFHPGQPNEVRAVQEVSLDIAAGEAVLLGGASGSGKTTLLTLLAGLSRPTSGRYYCLGEELSRWSEKFLTRFRQKHIGVVFQHFQLIEGLTAAQNIAVPLLPSGLKPKTLQAKVQAAAEAAEIAHRLSFPVQQLSGGELQRVAIARGLVAEPKILFLDEPTSHLDSHNAERLLAVLEKLKKEGRTLILTSHDPVIQQATLLDRVLLLKDGKVSV